MAGLRATGRVGHVSSELDGIDQTWKNSGFAVAVDPLSGSSIIDTNFAVGTIFGIWGGGSLADVTGRELLAAGVCVYGPRTTFTLALAEREQGTILVTQGDSRAPRARSQSLARHDGCRRSRCRSISRRRPDC